MLSLTATALTPTLDAWRAKLAGGVAQRIATRAAHQMQLAASDHAPRDTHALSQSIAVQTPEDSDYADRIDTAAALADIKHKTLEFFPEPAPPTNREDVAVVLSVVTYASYVNGGTHKMAAQPFWDRARGETEAAFAAMADAEWKA